MKYVSGEDLNIARGISYEEGNRLKLRIIEPTEAFVGSSSLGFPEKNFPLILREGEYYKGAKGFFVGGDQKMIPLIPKEAWEENCFADLCFYVPFENLVGKAVLIDLDLSTRENEGEDDKGESEDEE